MKKEKKQPNYSYNHFTITLMLNNHPECLSKIKGQHIIDWGEGAGGIWIMKKMCVEHNIRMI